jgi:hypothetical protein
MFRHLCVWGWMIGLGPGAACAQAETARIHIDRMSGFEQVLAAVAEEEQVPGVLVELADRPHYRISQGPRFRSLQERKLHYSATGRMDDLVLDFWDARTRRTIVSYTFRMPGDLRGQARVARQFLREVRRKLR